ncbi:MAG: radical SAM protein [Clostridia bacterium]|nr:radical SAM protein [Clostridia bacterium]
MEKENLSYKKCTLCARRCGVDRTRGERGFCRMPSDVVIARAALHMWEEPVISGTRGSGTVFFSGCSLGCIYCQNKEISGGELGSRVTTDRLSGIYTELEAEGAHNVNLVTPTHYLPSIIESVDKARAKGLTVPIVYNTSSYETREALRALSDTVDVFLPDLKYYKPSTASALSLAKDYPSVAWYAIEEMVRLRPEPVITDGLLKSGVLIRILLLPGHLAEAKLNVKRISERFSDSVYVSLMSQYTPSAGLPSPLDRRVTRSEYEELVDYAVGKGIRNAFIQDYSSADASYVPPFDLTGV